MSTVAAQMSRPGLHSADTTNYVQPQTRTKFAERTFSYAGPAVSNTSSRLTFSSLLLVDFIFRFLITYFDICIAPILFL